MTAMQNNPLWWENARFPWRETAACGFIFIEGSLDLVDEFGWKFLLLVSLMFL
jgi:hypothetical protein